MTVHGGGGGRDCRGGVGAWEKRSGGKRGRESRCLASFLSGIREGVCVQVETQYI